MLRNVFFEPCMEGLQTGLRNILFRATTGGLLEIEGNGRERECSFTYHNRPPHYRLQVETFLSRKRASPSLAISALWPVFAWFTAGHIQRSEKWLVRGWVKFVPALAYLFWLTLPGSCLTRFTNIFSHLCIGYSFFKWFAFSFGTGQTNSLNLQLYTLKTTS